MKTSDTLVVFYSRTGNTAKVAHAIATPLHADVERLADFVDRDGVVGFVRSLKDAITREPAKLQPLAVDPTRYGLVIIGTPDWGKSISAPARAFLLQYKGRLQKVAFFLTDGEADHAAIFKEMATLVGSQPVATLGIPGVDVERGAFEPQVTRFVAEISSMAAVDAGPLEKTATPP